MVFWANGVVNIYLICSIKIYLLMISKILFYSCFCFMRQVYFFFTSIFRGMIHSFARLLFSWDPKGVLHKRFKNVDEYIKRSDKGYYDHCNDIRKGSNVPYAHAYVGFIMYCYVEFILSLLKKCGVLPKILIDESMNIVFIVSVLLAGILMYFCLLRKDVYIEGYMKIEKDKNHLKWHILSFLIFLGALACKYYSLELWFH